MTIEETLAAQQRYDQLWRELKLCDELGFDHSFCVEHHFRHDESWMAAPMLYAVAAGVQTKRIRPGSMGAIVPLYLERFRPKGQFSHYRG